VSAVWATIAAVAVANAGIKAVGPLLVGARELPPWAPRVIALLVPALLGALVLVGTVADGSRIVLDARLAGVAAGAAALLARAPLAVALVVAAAATALVRAL
jgi:branched-subunit amino acid transport protein